MTSGLRMIRLTFPARMAGRASCPVSKHSSKPEKPLNHIDGPTGSGRKLLSFEDSKPMTDWFARPVLHVRDVEASLRFYVDRLGFTSPWRYDEDGRARVAQVDRQGCALILADTWPEKIGKGLMFISLNVEPA